MFNVRKVQGSRLNVQCSMFVRFKVQGSMFKVQGSRFKVQGSRLKVQGSRFKVQCSMLNVQCSMFNALKPITTNPTTIKPQNLSKP
jgi:hypothetical protein